MPILRVIHLLHVSINIFPQRMWDVTSNCIICFNWVNAPNDFTLQRFKSDQIGFASLKHSVLTGIFSCYSGLSAVMESCSMCLFHFCISYKCVTSSIMNYFKSIACLVFVSHSYTMSLHVTYWSEYAVQRLCAHNSKSNTMLILQLWP